MFAGWGSRVARLRWSVLAVALVAVISAGVWGFGVFDRLSEGGYNDPDSESGRAAEVVAEALGGQGGDVIAIYTPDQGKIDDAALTKRIKERLAALPESAVSAQSSYWTATGPARAGFAAEDKSSAVAIITLAGHGDGEKMDAYAQIEDDFAVPGAHVQMAGAVPLNHASSSRSTEDLASAELISLPVVLVLLLLIFGSLVAAALPVLIGGCAVLGSLGVLHAVALTHEVNSFAVNVASLLGLGMAIDYGLFMVGRFREEQANHSTAEAVRRTVATAGRTVLFSATLLMTALAGLLLFPQGFLKSLAYGGLAAVFLAMLLSLTLLPAILAIIGPGVDRLPVRLPGRRDADSGRPGGWERLAASVLRRPFLVALPILAALLALALPITDARFGETDERVLPAGDESRVAVETLKADYPQFSADGVQLVVRGTGGEKPDVRKFTEAAGKVPGIGEVTTSGAGDDVVVLNAALESEDSFSAGARQAVEDLRALEAPSNAEVLVGGATARNVDSLDAIADQLPLMIGLLAGATLLLMFLAFGSILLPIKAVVVSALSLCATFGALVWIFQEGHGAGLLDVTPAPLEAGIVVLMAAVVFGLSTDYEVFLLSRMVEARTRGATTAEAVSIGLSRTGRVISAAALLLIVVTGAFALSSVTTMKFIGVGMIIALVLDATVVRMLLVPAVLALFGDAAWWAPGPLRRLQERAGLAEHAGEAEITDWHPATVTSPAPDDTVTFALPGGFAAAGALPAAQTVVLDYAAVLDYIAEKEQAGPAPVLPASPAPVLPAGQAPALPAGPGEKTTVLPLVTGEEEAEPQDDDVVDLPVTSLLGLEPEKLTEGAAAYPALFEEPSVPAADTVTADDETPIMDAVAEDAESPGAPLLERAVAGLDRFDAELAAIGESLSSAVSTDLDRSEAQTAAIGATLSSAALTGNTVPSTTLAGGSESLGGTGRGGGLLSGTDAPPVLDAVTRAESVSEQSLTAGREPADTAAGTAPAEPEAMSFKNSPTPAETESSAPFNSPMEPAANTSGATTSEGGVAETGSEAGLLQSSPARAERESSVPLRETDRPAKPSADGEPQTDAAMREPYDAGTREPVSAGTREPVSVGTREPVDAGTRERPEAVATTSEPEPMAVSAESAPIETESSVPIDSAVRAAMPAAADAFEDAQDEQAGVSSAARTSPLIAGDEGARSAPASQDQAVPAGSGSMSASNEDLFAWRSDPRLANIVSPGQDRFDWLSGSVSAGSEPTTLNESGPAREAAPAARSESQSGEARSRAAEHPASPPWHPATLMPEAVLPYSVPDRSAEAGSEPAHAITDPNRPRTLDDLPSPVSAVPSTGWRPQTLDEWLSGTESKRLSRPATLGDVAAAPVSPGTPAPEPAADPAPAARQETITPASDPTADASREPAAGSTGADQPATTAESGIHTPADEEPGAGTRTGTAAETATGSEAASTTAIPEADTPQAAETATSPEKAGTTTIPEADAPQAAETATSPEKAGTTTIPEADAPQAAETATGAEAAGTTAAPGADAPQVTETAAPTEVPAGRISSVDSETSTGTAAGTDVPATASPEAVADAPASPDDSREVEPESSLATAEPLPAMTAPTATGGVAEPEFAEPTSAIATAEPQVPAADSPAPAAPVSGAPGFIRRPQTLDEWLKGGPIATEPAAGTGRPSTLGDLTSGAIRRPKTLDDWLSGAAPTGPSATPDNAARPATLADEEAARRRTGNGGPQNRAGEHPYDRSGRRPSSLADHPGPASRAGRKPADGEPEPHA